MLPRLLLLLRGLRAPQVDDLERALELVLAHEGGWSDHPADRGGQTMYGITAETHRVARRLMPDLPTHVRDLTKPQARAIYERLFWEDSLAHLLPWPGSYLQFDAAIQHSPVRAIRFIQEVTGAAVDGVPGPETRRRIQDVTHWGMAARDLLVVRAIFYIRVLRTPSQHVFAGGWANRLHDVWRTGTGR